MLGLKMFFTTSFAYSLEHNNQTVLFSLIHWGFYKLLRVKIDTVLNNEYLPLASADIVFKMHRQGAQQQLTGMVFSESVS